MAIVHDFLTQRGGAERVVLAMLRAFPSARVITSVYDPAGTFPEFRNYDVEATWLNRFGMFQRDPRRALPLLPLVFGGLEISDVDVVLCSSSVFAHGIRTTAPKIVYCHNPPRWIYQIDDYFQSHSRLKALARLCAPVFRHWDQRAAAGAARYLTNSSTVRARVHSAYGLAATVLPPPVSLDPRGPREPIPSLEPGFLLTVGRRRGYKNSVALAEAVERMPAERLVVVGGLAPKVNGKWTDRVTAFEGISDAQLRWLYAEADALVAVSHEDFGLTPIEAYAFGTPAIVLRRGGYLDTTEPGRSGVFVDEPTPAAIEDAVGRFRQARWERDDIRAHAARWAPEEFVRSLRDIVAQHAVPGWGSPRRLASQRRPDPAPVPAGAAAAAAPAGRETWAGRS